MTEYEKINNIQWSDLVKEKFYYRLRININGFDICHIKVNLVNIHGNKKKIRIQAIRNEKKGGGDNEDGRTIDTVESSKEFTKFYEILSDIDESTMNYYLDPKNPLYLIVEFLSNSNENVYVNLDDSCESLVEMAAKSLLNLKNIEEIRSHILNPFDSTLDSNSFSEIFSPSLIKDISIASLATLTPIKTIQNTDGSLSIRIDLNVPFTIKSASLAKFNKKNINENSNSVENIILNELERKNHLNISFDGLNLHLEANTVNENVSSLFNKVIKLPRGTITRGIQFNLDKEKHQLTLEAPLIS